MSGVSRRKAAWLGAGWLTFGVLVVGPWPAGDTPYTATDSFRDTADRLSGTRVAISRGPVRVGVAEVDLTPTEPVPVAGFLDGIMQPYVGINSRCSARALTIASGGASVTVLAADLLLIDAPLARRILARTGLARDQIYFTATHTHSGPGGWGNHPLERLVAGTFDPVVANELVDRLARVVLASRARLEPVEVAFGQTAVSGLQRNRIDPGAATNDLLSAWFFRATGRASGQPIVATLASFGAHPTIAHPHPARLGGDYPGAFVAALRQRGIGGTVLFAAGTIGDSSPVRPPGANFRQSVHTYGEALADRLVDLLGSAQFHRETPFANLGLEVALPPVQVPFGSARLRFSPLAVWWISPRRTFLHTVRLGPAFLVGFPGDCAGQLAAGFQTDPPVVATSFNGDYKGYLVTPETFRTRSCYETRWMSFFGPDLGASLVDLAARGIHRLSDFGG